VAVTGMVELRNTLRGFAITGAGPAHLLGWLNQVACELTEGTIGTAFCGLYDPAARQLRWARAGHLPPILVRGGEAAQLPLSSGLMLGADPGAAYEEITTALCPGDVLLLFTDGLVERRDSSIDEALATLIAQASRPAGSIASYADLLVSQAGANTGDDACLVAVQVR
jgi:serine phosphatase RsbU (regulator of sigma subunit)